MRCCAFPGMMTAESSIGADDLAGLDVAVLAQIAPLVEKLNEARSQEGAALVAEMRASMLRLRAFR